MIDRALVPVLTAVWLLALPSVATGQDAPPPPGEEPAAQAQEAPAPMELESYQLVLLKRPAAPAEYPQDKLQEIQAGHMAHLGRMAREGHMVAAGPFGDQEDERLRGLALYRVESIEEARRLAEADPAVEAGRLEVEVMTWYTQKGALAFPLFEELSGAEEPDG